MRLLIPFITVLLFLTSCGSFNKILKSDDIDYKFHKAQDYYKAEKYQYVIQIFSPDYFPLLKGTKEFEEAFYMFAYSHYYEKDYFNAEKLFKQFSETFTNSTRALEMEYMSAYIFYKQSPKVDLEQTNTLKSIGMMQTFINRNPEAKQVKEATVIIEECKQKLEQKDYKAAELYYHMGQYRASCVAFNNMVTNFPESNQSDYYSSKAIKAYYQFALLSIEDRKIERLEEVVVDCNEFTDKYFQSKYKKEIEELLVTANNNIKKIKNEQIKAPNGS